MSNKRFVVCLLLAGLFTTTVTAQDFTLSSNDISEGQQLAAAQVFQGFGCEGENISPQLSWSNAPAGTKSFVVTAYDPDAPTGSGWWHWNVVNIPADVMSLDAGAGGKNGMPEGASQLRNDYGTPGFGGACPPPGEVHRYQFTVYALGTMLELPPQPSNALAGFMTRANALASASITAVYTR
ncbi:MAG: YbhB/YbcL family Raf kinase inhibitor-like protein [Bacteroidota bacterium]